MPNNYNQTYYSAANVSFIFPAYLYAVGQGEIRAGKINSNNIQVSVLTQPLCSISAKVKNSFTDISKNLDLNYKKMLELASAASGSIKETGLYLSDISYTTVNKDTEELPSGTYQEQLNIPAKDYIFSSAYTATNTSSCRVYNDYEFSEDVKKYLKPEYIPYSEDSITACEKSIENDEKIQEDKKQHDAITASKYFYEQYNFSSGFNKDDYDLNLVTLDSLIESRICCRAADFIMNQERLTSSFSGVVINGLCNGIILSYENNHFSGDNKIPMAYYEFSKPLAVNNNSLHVEFNINGIYKVE